MKTSSATPNALTWAILCLLPFCLIAQNPAPMAPTTIEGQAGSQPVRWQATYTTIYSEDTASTALTLGPGLQLQSGASIVTDPTLMLPGTASIHLKTYGAVATNPTVVPLSGNATYIIEFKYRVLDYGSNPYVVIPVYLIPAGDNNQQHLITAGNMVKSAPMTGTFSTGAQTANAAQYYFQITASGDSDVVINDIKVIRQDPVQHTTPPSNWATLESLPFPRLGRGFEGATSFQNRVGMLPFQYSVDQIESRLAFNDVIAELEVDTQTRDPGAIRRLRQLNPNAVILPYRISEEQEQDVTPPLFAQVSLTYPFFQGIPDDWYAKDTAGNFITEDNYARLRLMNISPFCPAVNGQTFVSSLLAWLNEKVFPSGLWDGVFLDNFFAEANIHLSNFSNPALFNFDWNRNGIRDETPASTNEMTRNAVIAMLQQFRSVNGDMQLVIGNAGTVPELPLAPYVNGSYFECIGDTWNISNPSESSTGAWRGIFDAYRRMQATSRSPRINLIEGCGAPNRFVRLSNLSDLNPTPDDLRMHRMTLGTTLLSDGYYSFDLFAQDAVPLWYDEYSVDSQGNAVEDRTKKGYLGLALADAVELSDSGSVVLQESFDGAVLPPAFRANPASAVSVSNGVLTISSPDHTQNATIGINTNPNVLQLNPGTYLLTFDWKVLDTLDHMLNFNLVGSDAQRFSVPWVISGDSGMVHFPFAISTAGSWTINISISGGGKVAIDNIRVVRGGVGPWRRDFENGFVLVNPLPQPHTFSAADLAGTLHRTGIKRIKGTQAPDINNGQPVTGDLTVGAFDAVILLADRIAVATPSIAAVGTPGGFPDIAQNGWIEIKGTNLAPPGAGPAGMTWDKAPSFESGVMPNELGGVRVNVNGKPAFVYFVSSNQVNVLSPLDETTGPVQIVLSSGGVSSAPFVANLRAAAPSFPLVGSTKYVVATHADYSLIGPASLSSPGYTFTPARAGETVILYAFGLGLPATPLVNGASTQSGLLPALPQVRIGGATAAVSFAGVISPGLYQLNVTIPLNAASGDNTLTLTYTGQNSPAGDLILVQ